MTNDDADKIIDKLRESYVIVPKWAIGVWTAAILLVLAGIGVTSIGGFNSAVAASAAKAAEGRATIVAEEKASEVAAKRAGEAVDRVFNAATSAAEETAKRVAQRVATEMATAESRKAAEQAARDWLKQQTNGKDVVAYLDQQSKEADKLLAQMQRTSKNVDVATLAGLETKINDLSAWQLREEERLDRYLLPLAVGLENLYSHTANRDKKALVNMVMPAYDFYMAKYGFSVEQMAPAAYPLPADWLIQRKK